MTTVSTLTGFNAVVLKRHLSFSVGAKIRQNEVFTNFRKPASQFVSKRNRSRHQLRGLVARITYHHPLVAGAYPVYFLVAHFGLPHFEGPVNAPRYIGRLLVNSRYDRAGIAVETVFSPRVADIFYSRSDYLGDIDVHVGRYLPCHDNQSSADQSLAGYPTHRFTSNYRVENTVGDLVREFVWVTLCH